MHVLRPAFWTILVSLVAGCASEPAYTYLQTSDSVVLRGYAGKGLFLETKQAEVDIARIDGISVERIQAFNEPRYVAPGAHVVLIKLIHYDINAVAQFPMTFKAARHYRFTAIPKKDDFDVMVYDETQEPKVLVFQALVPRRRQGGIIIQLNELR